MEAQHSEPGDIVVFDEPWVFCIDHHLGKETVQNLLALRFDNALLEPLWRNAHTDHVQISVLETVGVKNRGGYYNNAGRCATCSRRLGRLLSLAQALRIRQLGAGSGRQPA